MSRRATLCLLFSAAFLAGCFSSAIVKSRGEFYDGDYHAAARELAKIANKKNNKDHIVALMEYGMALHVAGDYRASIDVLLQADRSITENDYIHAGEAAGSMLTNEMVTTFRPENFERVLVHTYLAMNFMMLDDWSGARVEARRALKILDSLDEELRGQPFTRYVCGLAYEMNGDRDDAYIEYKKVAKYAPEFIPIYSELYRIARRKGDMDDARKWAAESAKRGVAASDDAPPNLVIFVGAGRGPYKQEINTFIPPYANRFVLPDYVSSGSLAHHAVLKIDGKPLAQSFVLTDLDPLAETTLKKRIAKEIAKEAARVAAKEALVQELENQNQFVGLAARLAFIASEAADIRSWETLPRYLAVINQSLPPGAYDLSLDFYTREGTPLDAVSVAGVEIRKDRRTVLSVRSIR